MIYIIFSKILLPLFHQIDWTIHFIFMEELELFFFDVIKTASNEMMIDLDVKKLGLKDLLDSEFSGRELE